MRPRALVLAGSLMAGLSSVVTRNPRLVIRISEGDVRGSVAGGVVSWKGIPFAAPPIGQLRWRAPQPAQLSPRTFWTCVREFSSFRRGKGRLGESDADPRHGSARLRVRPRDPLLRGSRLQTLAGLGGRKAVSSRWSSGRVDRRARLAGR